VCKSIDIRVFEVTQINKWEKRDEREREREGKKHIARKFT